MTRAESALEDPAIDPWLSAAEASRALTVTRPTLYAYVSRGFIRSEAKGGSSRQRRYSRDDVDRLRRRTEERRDPEKVAAHALQWGMPILESSITLIAGDRLYYRGHDAVDLARSRSVNEVASLIWTGRFDSAFAPTAVAGPGNAASPRSRTRPLPFIARAQSTLAIAAARDPLAFDLRPERVSLTGWRIVHLLTRAASDARPPLLTIDERLARAWNVKRGGGEVVRAALILCADHELNVSAFTARCVASSGSNPYAVVIAGLAALEGAKHGGMTARVESLLHSMRRERRLRTALADRLRRGETIDGLGIRSIATATRAPPRCSSCCANSIRDRPSACSRRGWPKRARLYCASGRPSTSRWRRWRVCCDFRPARR